MVNQNIVAIGGGGFGRSLGNLKIEKYIVSLVNKKVPKICFIPTASGDNDLYKLNFYRAFSKLNCETSHIDFFSRTEELEEKIFSQDIVYVGGGNTKSMLAVWREWNLNSILKKAYDNGIVLSGVSAGAICWFVKGIACPHFDEEKEREPYVIDLIKRDLINSCICIEGYSALHINKNGFKTIDFGDNKKCFNLYKENKKILKKFF